MEKDREVDQLLEIHDDLRARTKVWLRNEDWGEEESRRLREEAALMNHRRYLRRIPSYRVLAEWSGVGENLEDVEVIKTELMSTDDIFKSYDPKLIDRGDWQEMTSWLRKVFHSEIPGDFTRVRTMEEWIQRLAEEEVYVVCSSGTSGDYSFVPRDPLTRQAGMMNVFGTPYQIKEICEMATVHGSVDLPDGSILISGGGWKSFENERIDKAELLRRTEACLGLGAGSMMEGYSMTDLNVMMICCGPGTDHAPGCRFVKNALYFFDRFSDLFRTRLYFIKGLISIGRQSDHLGLVRREKRFEQMDIGT